MGKVQRRGVKYQCLDERECTIKEVVSSLRLKPLTKKEELELRDQLGFALGKWEEPYSGSQNEDVIRSLRAHVKWLDRSGVPWERSHEWATPVRTSLRSVPY